MKKEEAEALKLQIIERRNYFKQLEHFQKKYKIKKFIGLLKLKAENIRIPEGKIKL